MQLTLSKFFAPPCLALACLTVAISGCGSPFWLPPAHKIEIQQGNLVTQDQVERLTPGMSKEQVMSEIGQPILDSSFHSDRWDYVYTRGPAGNAIKARQLSIYFESDTIARLDDNYAEETGVIERRKSWWRRLFQR